MAENLELALGVAKQFAQDKHRFHPTGPDPFWPKREVSSDDRVLDALRREEYLSRTDKGPLRLSGHENIFASKLAQERGIAGDLLRNVITKVDRATNLLASFSEVRQLYLPIEDNVQVEWDTPYQINGAPVHGVYLPTEKTIKIAYPEPTDAEQLAKMAGSGYLARVTQYETHEKMHAVQFLRGEGENIPPELIEAQSWRAMQLSIVEKPHDYLVGDVVGSPSYGDLSPRKFESAVWLIDRFAALGFSQEDILTAVGQPGEWNESQGFWKGLKLHLDGVMRGYGMTDEGMERAVLARHVQETIQRRQAKKIAQEIVYKAFEPEIKHHRRKGKHRRPQEPPIRMLRRNHS